MVAVVAATVVAATVVAAGAIGAAAGVGVIGVNGTDAATVVVALERGVVSATSSAYIHVTRR